MSREKYLTDIDGVLAKFARDNYKGLGGRDKVNYSKDMEDEGLALKVAFDVYKMPNDPYHGLWILQEENGQQYLVRASNPEYENTVTGDWSAISDYDNKNVTLSYKHIPIARFSSDKYGFNQSDIGTFKMALLDSVHENEAFIKDIINEQPESKRVALATTFPEFSKFLKG